MIFKKQIIKNRRIKQRPGYSLSPLYLTIHSTGNPKSTAQNEADYVCFNSDRQASFHFVVDEKEIIQVLPENEVAWHAGDGGTGAGNRKSLSIEICESGDRKKTLTNAAYHAATLLKRHNISIKNMVQHNHWSGKDCPRILRDKNLIVNGMDWSYFVKLVENYLKPEEEKVCDKTIYKKFEDVPEWGKEAVKFFMDHDALKGDGEGNINLSYDLTRMITIIYRLNV